MEKRKHGTRTHLGVKLGDGLYEYACMGISIKRFYYRCYKDEKITCAKCKRASSQTWAREKREMCLWPL